jgi:hypothetical protein
MGRMARPGTKSEMKMESTISCNSMIDRERYSTISRSSTQVALLLLLYRVVAKAKII